MLSVIRCVIDCLGMLCVAHLVSLYYSDLLFDHYLHLHVFVSSCSFPSAQKSPIHFVHIHRVYHAAGKVQRLVLSCVCLSLVHTVLLLLQSVPLFL